MSEWHIPLMKPNDPTQPNPVALVGCKIVGVGIGPPTGFEFRGPSGNVRSTFPGNPDGSFVFPPFRARLNGTHEREWFITVESLHFGSGGRLAWGYFSDFPLSRPGKSQDDPDVWVAHAGATADEDEGKDSAAASASSSSY